MARTPKLAEKEFRYHRVHPGIILGMASDRYAGWIGQIYSEERYQKEITRRTHKVGEKSFTEEVLPIGSLTEYFQHSFPPSGNRLHFLSSAALNSFLSIEARV